MQTTLSLRRKKTPASRKAAGGAAPQRLTPAPALSLGPVDVSGGGQSLEDLSRNFLLSANLINPERLLTDLFLLVFCLHKRTNRVAAKPESRSRVRRLAARGKVWPRQPHQL